MENEVTSFDELFKQSIESIDTTPSRHVWSNISNELANNSNKQLQNTNKKLKYAALVLLLFIGAGLIYFYNYTKVKNNTKPDIATNLKALNNNVKSTDNTVNTDVANYQQHSTNDVSNTITGKKNKGENANVANQIEVGKLPAGKVNDYEFFTEQIKKQKLSTDNYNKKNVNSSTKINTQASNINSNNVVADANEVVDDFDGGSLQVSKNIFPDLFQLLPPMTDITDRPKVPNNISASNVNNASTKKKKTNKNTLSSIAVFGSPTFNFTNIKDHKKIPPNQNGGGGGGRPPENRQKIKEGEAPSSTIVGGASVAVQINKRFTLQLGLNMNYTTNVVAPKKIFAEQDRDGKIKFKCNSSLGSTYINPKTGTTISIGDSTHAVSSKNSLTYMQLPITIGYSFNKDKWQIMPYAGGGINFLISKKSNITTKDIFGNIDNKTVSLSDVSKAYITGTIGLQINYQLSQKWSIMLSPDMQIAFTPITKNAPVKTYPNLLGLQLGIRRKLNK